MAISTTSVRILTEQSNKLKQDKDYLSKELAKVISQIDALQLNKRALQKEIDDCTAVINDLRNDIP